MCIREAAYTWAWKLGHRLHTAIARTLQSYELSVMSNGERSTREPG